MSPKQRRARVEPKVIRRTIVWVFIIAVPVTFSFPLELFSPFPFLEVSNLGWILLMTALGVTWSLVMAVGVLVVAVPLLYLFRPLRRPWLRVTAATLPGWAVCDYIWRMILGGDGWAPVSAFAWVFVPVAAAVLTGVLVGLPLRRARLEVQS